MLIKHRVYSSQKPGFYELWQAVKKVPNQSKIIPTLYNDIEVFSSASDGSKSVAAIFYESPDPDDSVNSQSNFPSGTNLRLDNSSIILKRVEIFEKPYKEGGRGVNIFL